MLFISTAIEAKPNNEQQNNGIGNLKACVMCILFILVCLSVRNNIFRRIFRCKYTMQVVEILTHSLLRYAIYLDTFEFQMDVNFLLSDDFDRSDKRKIKT